VTVTGVGLIQPIKHRAGGSGSSFSPLDIPDLFGWWDASDVTTFSYSAPNEVSQWADKSGNARHFSQWFAAWNPLANSVTKNGLNVIHFDGVTDILLGPAGVASSDPCTIFTCIKRNSGTRVHFSNGGTSVGWSCTTNGDSGLGYGMLFQGIRWVGTGVASTAWTIHTAVISNFAASAVDYAVYKENVLQVSGNTGIAATAGALQVGGDDGARDNIYAAEVILVKRNLSPAEREQVFNYLQAKWAI